VAMVSLLCVAVVAAVAYIATRSSRTGQEYAVTSVGTSDPTGQGTHGAAAAGAGSVDELTPEQRRELQRIATLGYVSGTEPVGEQSGVTIHEPAAQSGLTLYSGSEEPAAYLIDMDGNVVHEWSYPGFKSWGRVRVFGNGDLLVITEEYPHLMKLDKDSRLLWEWNKAAHHDVEVLSNGTIAVLVAEEATRPYICGGRPFLTDSVILLDPTGKPTFRAPLLEAFERSSRFSDWLPEHIEPDNTDPLHANSLELFREDGRERVLLSVRNIDAVVVMDLESVEVVRVITGPWRRQHEARWVGDGRILLFDNQGLVDRSRVIEYDVAAGKTVWSFTEPDFHSDTEGAQQRLSNGNTLVVESDNGRIVEVTRDGRIVWEYINPRTTVVDGRKVILGIARAERLPEDFPMWWAGTASR
jgi:hypothetical protein